MKKTIRIVPLILAIAGTFSTAFSTKEKANVEIVQVANDLPTMPITLVNGSKVQTKTLPGSTILVLFQPDCDHCQREAEAISMNIKAFRNYSVYFISAAPIPEIAEFAKEYKLDKIDNVHFATTEVKNIIDSFGQISAPSMYVYNKAGKLKTKFNGETDIAEILKGI